MNLLVRHSHSEIFFFIENWRRKIVVEFVKNWNRIISNKINNVLWPVMLFSICLINSRVFSLLSLLIGRFHPIVIGTSKGMSMLLRFINHLLCEVSRGDASQKSFG